MREFEILEPVPRDLIIVGRPLFLVAREIGSDARRVLRTRVEKIHEDNKPDKMVIVEGKMMDTHETFRTPLFPVAVDGRYGLLATPCTPNR